MTLPSPRQPDIRLTLDSQGIIREATAFNRMADEAVDAWVGRAWSDTVDAAGAAGLEALLAQAVDSGVSPYLQVEQRLPSGDVVPVEYMAVSTGGHLMAVGNAVPSVARPQSALSESQRAGHGTAAAVPRSSTAGLIHMLPDGFVVTDARGVILEANQAFVEMVEAGAGGAVRGETVGRWLGSPGGDEDMLLGSLRAGGRVRLFPATLVGSLGGRVDAEITGVYRRDAGGSGQVGLCIHDVSRRLSSTPPTSQLGEVLSSLTEQLGKTSLKSLVGMTVGLVERHYITEALSMTGGNRTAAARLLGLSRQSLYVKLARYGLDEDGQTGEPS